MSKKNKTNDNMINFYELKNVQKYKTKSINPHYKDHNISVPFRSIFIGSSGSGKTNTVLNLISQMSNTFNKIYIYTRAEEPLYTYLKDSIPDDLITISYDLNDLRKFKDADYYGQTLIIMDDLVNEKDLTCVNELYIRGRKMGVSLAFLSQSYYKINKIIRLQCQYVFIIKVSGLKDLNLILSEYALNTNKEQLQKMYNYCSQIFGDFFLIDLNSTQNKNYRKNFKQYLNPIDFK